MRLLAIRQPWIEATRCGWKLVDSRPQPTRYRGEVALHSTKDPEPDVDAWLARMHGGPALRPVVDGIEASDLTYGAVLAVAEIVGCHAAAYCRGCSDWAVMDGGYHWVFADIRRLTTPVPATGRLGLMPLPPEVEASVRAQLDKEDA